MITSSVKTPSGSADALTSRGRRTRDALLEAARSVFESAGFLDARVERITQQANVSYGTFYRYFDSKEDIFRELSTQLFEDIHRRDATDTDASPATRLIASNRAYYQAYRRNAALMAIVEQVATFDDQFGRLRHEHRSRWTDWTSRAIANWQREGLARGDLDPVSAARAMAAMVDHTLYLWLVQGDESDEATLLDTLDRMCLGALGLERD